MSLNRVSSLETFTPLAAHSRDVSPSSRERRLSFNPLPESWDPPTTKPAYLDSVGAFEVTRWKRILQVFLAVVYCLFASGIVFGYAALKPVLKQEGAYQDVCAPKNEEAATVGVDVETCVEIHLNLMFTVAAVSTNVAALPVGTILDRFGPRACGLLGAGFLAAGALVLAYEQRLPPAVDGLLWGYLLLALGGPFTYISSFQLSNAFPRRAGLVLALLTGAFDASSALFLAYRVLFEHTAGAWGHRRFFLAYLAVPAAMAVLQLTVMPKQSYKTVGEMIEEVDRPLSRASTSSSSSSLFGHQPHQEQQEQDRSSRRRGRRDDQVNEHTALLEQERREHRKAVAADLEDLLGSKRADKQARREERKNERSGVWGVMHHNTAWEQIRSPWFILICLFTVIQMTRINYFVATIRPQYAALLHSPSRAAAVNHVFDLALPLGGLISIPFVGFVLDHSSTCAVLAALVTVATAIGALGLVPDSLPAAYAHIALFVLYRPFYYTAVSDYTAKVFGFRTFGTVYGTIICLAGLFNFSQSGLDYLFHETFRGDPVPVNVMLMAAGLVVGVVLVSYVGYQVRTLRRKMLELEAERATGLHN